MFIIQVDRALLLPCGRKLQTIAKESWSSKQAQRKAYFAFV